MDLKNKFTELLDLYFQGKLNRANVASFLASEVPIDAIKGAHKDLLPNCEWALRHIDEEGD
jgi:hypothetical protein